MEDVSDPPFRAVCKDNGADMMFSEFISSEGLIRDAIKSRQKLDFEEEERPFGIQIFGGDEEALGMSARICETVNPDLVDINFGCPVKKVAMKGAGAGVLKDIDLMVRLTASVVNSTSLPVTVKTRLGWDDNTKNIEEVAERLQDVGIKALSIHGRTRTQMYKGEADWTLIAKVKNNPRIQIPIFGNGDIDSAEKALEYKNRYGVDGVMIGRAAMASPWIFSEIRAALVTDTLPAAPTRKEKWQLMRDHCSQEITWRHDERSAMKAMRSRLMAYTRGMPGAPRLRHRLARVESLAELEDIAASELALDEVCLQPATADN